MFELLFTNRRRPIQPWILAARLHEWLAELAQLATAVADSLDDERWRTLARALHEAGQALRRAM